MSQTNILFISDVSIRNIIGGAERVLYEQAAGLVRRGYNIHIMTRRLPEHQCRSEIIEGVWEWRYDIDRRNAGKFFLSTLKNGKFLFENLQKRYRFACIHMQQPFSAFSILESPLHKNIRKVYTCHSLSFEEYISRNRKPGTAWGKMLFFIHCCGRKYMEKKVLHQADHIMVLSRFTKNRLRTVYSVPGNTISVNPGGVDLKKFYPGQDKDSIRKRLHIPADKFILFTVRNLVPRMGIENLLIAMKTVIGKHPDIHLVIGGDGPLGQKLKTFCHQSDLNSHVHFTGFIPEEDLADYYRAADLFILPTADLEGFGLVIPEALASGVPVLGTPVGGSKEILSLFDKNCLFSDTRPESLADLMMKNYQKCRTGISSWKHLSIQCREFAEKHYSWNRHLDMMENVSKGYII